MISLRDAWPAMRAAATAEVALSAMRHDLRNKLASVRNAAFYLRRRAEKTELWSADRRVPEFFQLISDELDAADGVVGRPVAPATLEDPAGSVRLGDCVREAVASLDPAPVVVDCSLSDSSALPGRRLAIAFALRCLLENALEATPPGGVVTLRARQEADAVAVRISDGGPGFSDEARRRGFDPFFTDKPGRAGLGLTLARRIVAEHQGTLEIGAPERGACVEARFVLPPRSAE